MKDKTVIIGGGISGLLIGFKLKEAGIDFEIIEAGSLPGGAMITENQDGFLIDYGPNSGLETTPIIKEVVDKVGLSDKMIYSNSEGAKRYILKNNELVELPTTPEKFLGTKLFSTKAKLRVCLEPFIGKSKDGYYQSLADFVTRRLGQEFLDYAIDPFVSGVFAGDPHKLSVKSAFGKLYRLEEVYGGLVKGMIRGAKERKKSKEESKQSAKMFSFLDGMQTFPIAVAKYLGDSVSYNSRVQAISKNDSKYIIEIDVEGQKRVIEATSVISTIPSHQLAKLLVNFQEKYKKHLNSIYYPPVTVLYVGYPKALIGKKLDGFGFLIPSKEKKNFLGAIWSSTIFNNRAPEDIATFTLFIGGARHPDFVESEVNQRVEIAIKEFNEIMQINSEPIFKKFRYWGKAIPQYNLGHIEHDMAFEEFEKENQGFFLAGNYRGGIAVGDCAKNSEIVSNRFFNYLNK